MAEIKTPASASVLYHGTATPYLAIFSEVGTPLLHPITGVPLGAYISQFQYKYDEEKHNECTITFDCGDPDVVDEKSFPKDMKLFVQWGYIYSDSSSVSSEAKALKVRDYDVEFDDQGVHSTLVCLDIKADLLSSPPVKPNGDENKTLDHYLENGCDLEIPVIIEAFT